MTDTASHTLGAQLCLQIVFTAVWAQPPRVCETFVARRDRFERLSLPLGSNFLITAPPDGSLTLFLRRKKHDEWDDTSGARERTNKQKKNRRNKVPSAIRDQRLMAKKNKKPNKEKFNCLQKCVIEPAAVFDKSVYFRSQCLALLIFIFGNTKPGHTQWEDYFP